MVINEKNLEDIYNDYFEVVCRYLNYYTRDIFLIEDVVQDVFVNLWQDYQDKEVKYIKTYLYNSARNKVLNVLRDQDNREDRLEQWAKIELDKNNSVDCVDRQLFYQLLLLAVETLPDKCKEIYLLNREGNLSYKEIADLKSISVNTVENQMSVALKKIRAYLFKHSSKTQYLLFIFYLYTKK